VNPEADGFIVPQWPAPAPVRALVTTRRFGDARDPAVRARLEAHVPAEPRWLRQLHGTRVCDDAEPGIDEPADARVTRRAGVVCVVMCADCLPVLVCAEDGGAVGAAHAGWRGLAAGVLEATVRAMPSPAQRLIAWLGPALGPAAYEVGAEVREAFLAHDAAAAADFAPGRAGRWQLDLYAAARRRLAAAGVRKVWGGEHCTHAEADRFYSWRRERAGARMAALVWIGQGAPRA
jgi:hypothetical protein